MELTENVEGSGAQWRGLRGAVLGAGVIHRSGIYRLSTLGRPAWDQNRLAEMLRIAEGNRPVDNSGTQNGAVEVVDP